jgi:hypothetical protein
MMSMRDGNRRQVGNLYYTTICLCSSQSSFIHCPCLVPPTPLTSHRLPPGASLPRSQSERYTRPCIMLRRSTTGTGSRAEVTTMGLAVHGTPGSSLGLPPGQDYYVPPRHCAYDCLVKMLHLQVYTHVRAVARRRGAGRPAAATKTIGVLQLGSNGIFSCKKMTIMQFVSRKK